MINLALHGELGELNDEVRIEEDTLHATGSSLQTITVVLSVWAVLITIGVFGLIIAIFRRLRKGKQVDDDQELGNPDDDDILSEKSSVIDLRLDHGLDLDLGEGQFNGGDKLEGDNLGFDYNEKGLPNTLTVCIGPTELQGTHYDSVGIHHHRDKNGCNKSSISESVTDVCKLA